MTLDKPIENFEQFLQQNEEACLNNGPEPFRPQDIHFNENNNGIKFSNDNSKHSNISLFKPCFYQSHLTQANHFENMLAFDGLDKPIKSCKKSHNPSPTKKNAFYNTPAKVASIIPTSEKSNCVYLELGQCDYELKVSHYHMTRNGSISSISSSSDLTEEEYDGEGEHLVQHTSQLGNTLVMSKKEEDVDEYESECGEESDNPILPGLFPKMNINDNSKFMKFDSLPTTPAYVSR